ncbi:MAG: YgiQ family radical SAM protein, partial [Halanaerobium sp. MSAO_Bac5]
MSEINRDRFMVISKEDMLARDWEQLDFIIVSGDAYIDHPSFGTAVIARVLEDAGFKVGIIAQPDWRELKDFKKLGKHR